MADKVREAGCPDGYGDRHAAKCENAVVAARVIEGAWGDGYIAGRRAALDAPLAAPTDKVREAAERWASSEVDAYPGRTLEDRIKSWMAGGVHPDDVEWFLIDAYEAGYRAALAAPSGGDATPRDEAVEPVAWAVVRANGTRDYVYQQEESAAASVARLNAETDEGFIVANQPYRVVALVPQQGGAR